MPAPTTQPSGAGPTSSAPRPAKTPVPAPTRGNVHETVPSRPVTTKSPVPINRPAEAGGNVVVAVASATAVHATARKPGEVSGPGVALTFRVSNGSGHSVDLGNVVVTLTDTSGAPGGAMTAPPARPFSGVLPSGKSATGEYIFTVPTARRHPLTVSVVLTADRPVLLFQGSIG